MPRKNWPVTERSYQEGKNNENLRQHGYFRKRADGASSVDGLDFLKPREYKHDAYIGWRTLQRKVPIFAEMLDKTVGGYEDIGGVRVVELSEDQTPPRLAYQPEHPDADVNGYVAFPNVNLVREMTDMLVASRAYEANLAVADSAKNMWNGALDIIRG